MGYHEALALLDWQIELGADEAILDAPVDRFALEDAPPLAPAAVASAPRPAPGPARPLEDAAKAPAVDAVAAAREAAAAAQDLPALKAALETFGLCPLSLTAQSLVFAQGSAASRVMLVVDAPRMEEDRQAVPVAGKVATLLDRMLDAIGLTRDGAADPSRSVYIVPMLPWRPPQDRDPSPEELAMMAPFVRRHIELAAPDILVLMGNHACNGLTGKMGILRLRGQWTEVMDRPAIPMFHPDYLLRKPHEKAKAWEDLLSLKARLRSLT